MENELYEKTYKNPKHFSFGKNWKNFLKTLTNERIHQAEQSLTNFLGGTEDIFDKTFVDIGCGSGLFSLAAHRLGAQRVVSVDIDEQSVSCARFLREKAGNPPNWEIITGSVLDKDFIRSLGSFDIIYSWGVLHHTGNMFQAFENVFLLTHHESKLYIALYNDNPRLLEGTSSFWIVMKKIYNTLPWVGKKAMEAFYILYYLLGLTLNGKNPFTYIRHYHSLRGMNFYTDVKDWLGGYPYEYASVQKIKDHFGDRGYECLKINPARSIGCNEYLFLKK